VSGRSGPLGAQKQIQQNVWVMGLVLLRTPKAVIYFAAAFCLAVLVFILRHQASVCKRWIILASAGLVGGLLAIISVLVVSQIFCMLLHPGIGIRRTRERFFAGDVLSFL
jgi:hypothetical protein